MDLTAYALTDVGAKREHNEDYMLSAPDEGLFVVCDGMGGHNAGEVASEMATKTVHRVVNEMRAVVDAVKAGTQPASKLNAVMRTAVETACREVNEAGGVKAERHGMGCTCTAILIAGDKACMGHVGDSRLYLCRSGTLTQLSEDHTFVAEAIKAGVFTPEEAALCGHKNVITRCIGKEKTVLVDTLVFDLGLGDTVLLCSDGLHGYFTDNGELARFLSEDTPSAIPPRLIGLANQRGGHDNITAIVIRAGKDASAADDAGRRSGDGARGLEALRGVDLMRDLSMAELVRFKQIFEDVVYEAGDNVVREGEVNDNLFVIVEGSAEVVRADVRIATLSSGKHFGEMSLLNSRPRSATVRALEHCSMLSVSRERLYWFLQQDGMLAAKFFWKLATTLSQRLETLLAQQQELQQAAASSGYYSGAYQRPG